MTKKHITKKSRNSKFKEKYHINKKTHLATEKYFVLQHSLKINKRRGRIPISSREGGWERNRKINKRTPRLFGT